MRPTQPSQIALVASWAPRVGTQFYCGWVVDGCESAGDGHGCVSAHGSACGSECPARVSVCVRARDYDMHASG